MGKSRPVVEQHDTWLFVKKRMQACLSNEGGAEKRMQFDAVFSTVWQKRNNAASNNCRAVCTDDSRACAPPKGGDKLEDVRMTVRFANVAAEALLSQQAQHVSRLLPRLLADKKGRQRKVGACWHYAE